MQPQQPAHFTPQATPPSQPHSGKSWAIALIVSAIFLLAAAGVVAWLLVTRGSSTVGNAVHVDTNNDTKNVKTVAFVAPTDLPASYAKNDQSKLDTTTIFYYDDASACGLTVTVLPLTTSDSVKDTIVKSIEAAETQGVTTANSAVGDTHSLKDASNGKTYSFDSVELTQNVNVQGINFTKQHNVVLYKQFGQHIASIGYACKDETWAAKKDELKKYVNEFTVKTTT